MQFQLYILFAITVTIRCSRRDVSKSEEAQLEKEHRNAFCCEKNMRCCVKPAPPPIEIRAMIARCPNMHTESEGSITRNINKPLLSVNEHTLKSFQGFDEDEPLIQSRVVNCRRKILLTLKLHHKGALNTCKNQYVVIDHVYDPITEKSVRLLNPYVVKLRQQPVKKAHLLTFVDFVNSEAKEVVYNKHDGNFTGCYTEKTHPTCGLVKFDGKIIPYSEGFCCSCDAKKNEERQPDSINDKNEAIVSYSDPSYLLDRVECPRNFYKDKEEMQFDAKEATKSSNRGEKRSTSGTQTTQTAQKRETQTQAAVSTSKRWQYSTFHSSVNQNPTSNAGKIKRQDFANPFKPKESMDDEDKYLKHIDLVARKKQPSVYIDDVKKQHTPSKLDEYFERLNQKLNSEEYQRKIRQASPSGVQKRGGQNCADRFTPVGKDPEHYHESAHCLRFSDVWYGIYKLAEPFVEQTISLNVYERFETETSADKWREVTNHTLYLSNRNPRWEDETPTISISLTTKTMDKCKKTRLHSRRLLIPEGVKKSLRKNYPEIQNGADEYLVVKPDQLAVEGDQCDKVGVGFEAFYKQPKRCSQPRNTCLRNQPKQLWKHDSMLQRKQTVGCYFLKYFANYSGDPFYTNEATGQKYLTTDFKGSHIAIIDIEMKADHNAIIRRQTTAVITEVYVDSTCEKLTTILIKVINSSLVSAKYMVQLSDFPLEMPESFGKIKSKLTLIPPQNQHIFNLEIRYRLPAELMYCSVEVLNENHELVALRRVRIQKFDRCICTWHCLCACVASSDGLKCNPMSLEQYHAAGFQGALPIVTYMVHLTMLDDLLSVAFYFALFLLAILLVLGLVKALMGLCCINVGVWGLSVLFDLPKPMSKYYEPSLRDQPVIYDEKGWPIHPSKGHKVRNISCPTEFCTNVVFFFIYPLGCCIFIIRRLCCPHYARPRAKAPTYVCKPISKEGGGKSDRGSRLEPHPKAIDSEGQRGKSKPKTKARGRPSDASKQKLKPVKKSKDSGGPKSKRRSKASSPSSDTSKQLESHQKPIEGKKERKRFKLRLRKHKKKEAARPYSDRSASQKETAVGYAFDKGGKYPEASIEKPKKKCFTKGKGFERLRGLLRRKSKAGANTVAKPKQRGHTCTCSDSMSTTPRPRENRKICKCPPGESTGKPRNSSDPSPVTRAPRPSRDPNYSEDGSSSSPGNPTLEPISSSPGASEGPSTKPTVPDSATRKDTWDDTTDFDEVDMQKTSFTTFGSNTDSTHSPVDKKRGFHYRENPPSTTDSTKSPSTSRRGFRSLRRKNESTKSRLNWIAVPEDTPKVTPSRLDKMQRREVPRENPLSTTDSASKRSFRSFRRKNLTPDPTKSRLNLIAVPRDNPKTTTSRMAKMHIRERPKSA